MPYLIAYVPLWTLWLICFILHLIATIPFLKSFPPFITCLSLEPSIKSGTVLSYINCHHSLLSHGLFYFKNWEQISEYFYQQNAVRTTRWKKSKPLVNKSDWGRFKLIIQSIKSIEECLTQTYGLLFSYYPVLLGQVHVRTEGLGWKHWSFSCLASRPS